MRNGLAKGLNSIVLVALLVFLATALTMVIPERNGARHVTHSAWLIGAPHNATVSGRAGGL